MSRIPPSFLGFDLSLFIVFPAHFEPTSLPKPSFPMRESAILHSRYWGITLQRLTSLKERTNALFGIKENQEIRSDDERKLKQGE